MSKTKLIASALACVLVIGILAIAGFTNLTNSDTKSKVYASEAFRRIHTVARDDLTISSSAYDNSEGGRRLIPVDNHTFVAFYYDGSNIIYKVSVDKGETWDVPQSANTGIAGSDFLRWTAAATLLHGETHIVLLYSNAVSNNTMTELHAKEGIFSPISQSIKWENKPSTLGIVSNPSSCAVNIGGGACTAAVASTDTRGNIFAAFRWSANGTGFQYAIFESVDGGISWTTSMNATWAVAPGTRGEMSLARLSLGSMLFVYAPSDANELYYSVYHAGYWSPMNTTTGSGLHFGTVKQISSISDSRHFVYVFYVKDGNSGDLMVAKWNNMGVFREVETVDSNLSHSLPAASLGSDGVIHVFTLANDNVHEIANTGGSWTSPAAPFGTNFRNPDELTSAEAIPAAIWREDVNPLNDLFAIRFGY